MASPNSPDVGPFAALLNVIDSTFIAALMGLTMLGTLIGAAWNFFIRLDRVEKAAVQQRADHDRLAKLIEPLAGIDKRLDDIQGLLVQIIRQGRD
jgi:hypothetical protein